MLMLKQIVALLATMMVCGLYGAGLRRAFGALPRRPDIPRSLWYSSRVVPVADWIFVVFVLTMTVYLFTQMNLWAFLIFGSLSYVMAELLSHKITLVPSFYISIILALLAIALTAPLDWIIMSSSAISSAATDR
jgi:hypothetical protein